jgi:hypothetical protein
MMEMKEKIMGERKYFGQPFEEETKKIIMRSKYFGHSFKVQARKWHPLF